MYRTPRLSSLPKSMVRIAAQIALFIGVLIALSYGAAYGIRFVQAQQFLPSTTKIATNGSVTTLNPLFVQPYSLEAAVSRLLFRGLFTYDQDNNITGDLADRWEFLEDGKKLSVVLGDDVVWSDGEPITADDVVFTFSLVQDDAYTGWESQFFDGITVEKGDDNNSVTFTLPGAYSPLLDTLTVPILPQHAFVTDGITDIFSKTFLDAGVYSGPYVLSSYTQTTPVADEQWQELRLKNDISGKRFDLRVYPDQKAVEQAYTFGDVDGLMFTSWWDRPTFEPMIQDDLQAESLNGHYYALLFNLEKDNDVAVRKAFSQGIDRTSFTGSAAIGPIPYGSPYWVDLPDERVSFDGEAARQILEGKEFTITTLNQPEMETILIGVKAQLEERGAVIKELYLSPEEFQSKVLTDHDFEIALVHQYVGRDPDQYSFWHSSQISAPGLNIVSMKNRRVDKALEQGRSVSNFDERKTIYTEFQQRFLEEYPAVFLMNPPVYVVSRKDDTFNLNDISWDLQDILRAIQ